MNISGAGFGVRRSDGVIAWAALTALNGATAEHLITTSTEWILSDGTPTGEFREAPGAPFDVETSATLSVQFAYDGTSAVVIAFGGYDTDAKIDNIVIKSPTPIGDTWAGFEIINGQFVDTGSLLGILEISSDPWVYSYTIGKYIFAPQSAVARSGGWFYAMP
ncbi:hypothetical protein G0Q06_06095 [Puniceicoccales bacterium CK1056]|uniref:Uncharacterized protein n=1 Tax=Oceanipulchritudo coccoides TaxID=2706888 RepID=A0A6B2M0Y0_9BACT|nr:hypothetical protein [Oceanipulchritudo coccoides]NDV62016.1 hypothetical protein [Oceanipulchritudo coccoides]